VGQTSWSRVLQLTKTPQQVRVGQTSWSARDLLVPLLQLTQTPHRPTWTSAAGLESCPTKHKAHTQVAK